MYQLAQKEVLIEHKLSTAYHQQTNGHTERLNRTLAEMLSMYVSNDHHEWEYATLAYVTFAYNSSRHDTAGYSLYYLLYGRDPTLPFDTILPSVPHVATEYAREVIDRAHMARQVARSRLLVSQDIQKERYDRRHRDVKFAPRAGSPCHCVGLSQKLLSRYTGPYEVLRQVNDGNYDISPVQFDPSSSPTPVDIVHVSRLKSYFACSSSPDMRRDGAYSAPGGPVTE